MSFLKAVSLSLVALSAAGLALTLFSFGIWPLETASLWIPGYLLLAVAGGCGCALSRSGRGLGLAALCAAASLALLLPHHVPVNRHGAHNRNTDFRILQANVYFPNDDPEPLLRLVRETNPDVLLLQEVNEKWIALLKPLEARYPHHRYSPRYTNGGIDLAEFWSGETLGVEDLHTGGLPATAVTLRVNGRTVCFLNVHTAAPFSWERAERYQHQMELLARRAADRFCPVVVAGDLNAGVWSRHFTALLEQGGLVSARRSYGAHGTWPSFFPGPLRIALDHLLVSPGLTVTDCRAGPGIGSDHLPLITDLQIEQEPRRE
ncbi:MAG TPA: endonuclease/exonuclease/phosphatase family protein [Candidatus Hydrogenedentes bacterium]|nr:endonuclease/exonuclease/phosphatase family protein [Candidatus Hydrogenedentota bacterium]